MNKLLNSLKIFVLSAAFFLSGCGEPETKSNLLTVGIGGDFPPFEMTDKQGEIYGFDVDVAQALADKLGKKLKIVSMAFDALVLGVKQEKVDCIMSALSITKKRAEEMAMVHYYGKPLTMLPLLFWQTVPVGVTTIEDLAKLPNKTVTAQVGSLQEEVLSHYSCVDHKYLGELPDMMVDLKYGKSIAMVVEPAIAQALMKDNPELKSIAIPLKPEEQDFGNGIGIKKENVKFVAQIEKAIKAMKTDDTLIKLEQKWFGGNHGAQ